MRRNQIRNVVEDRLGHVVDRVFGKVGARDQIILDEGRTHIRGLALIGVRRNDAGLERRSGLRHDIRGDFDDDDFDRIREILDRGDAKARRLQRCVELAVLGEFARVREGQIIDLA